jgi:hypothetical protein
MRNYFNAVCTFGILLSTILPGAALAVSQVFPPVGCSPSTPLIAWDGNGNTYCTAIPNCGPNQVVTANGSTFSCMTLPTPAPAPSPVPSSSPAPSGNDKGGGDCEGM